MNENKKIIICVAVMLTFAVVFGFMVRFTLIPKAQGISTQTDSSETTSETTSAPVVTSTPTDSGFDEHPYMTSQPVAGGALQITQLLLSIRNILLMFFGFWFVTWCFSRMKIILKLLYGGKKN